MKRVVKIVLIASVIMLAGLAALMLYMNRIKKQQSLESEKELNKELDLILDDVEQIEFTKDDEIIPLYLTGKKKNVITKKASLSEIYTTAHTKKIDKDLLVEKKRGSRRIDNAVWAWNPYGTQPMSLYVYFPTRTDSYMDYTVSVDSKEIPDFTRVLNNNGEENLSSIQEYSIIGLIPGKKNYITLRLYDSNGSVQKQIVYSIDAPSLPKGIKSKIKMTKGYNQKLLSSGLYVVYGGHAKGQKGNYILFYDNSGYLRSYIPLKSNCAENIKIIDGCLLFPCSKTEFALLSPTGQVKRMYHLKGYQLYGGFSDDGSGNIYILADKRSDQSTIHDKIIQLELKSGMVSKVIDMGDYLKGAKKKAQKNSKNKKKLNWLDLNSIECKNKTTLILSARETSSILILNRINKAKPVLKSIIGEDVLWNRTGLNKKIAEKADSFTAQFGQHTVTWGDSGEYQEIMPELDENGNPVETETEETVLGGQYYLYMFNNNYGNSKTLPSVRYRSFHAGTKKKKADFSYYYQYLFDEVKNAYLLVNKIELPFSANDGSVQIYKENIIAGSSEKKVFMEYLQDSKMLHTYDTGFAFVKVEKRDMKGYWFY